MSVRLMRRLCISLFVLSLLCSSSLRAATIEYAWSGQLMPLARDDPWSLGPAGATFDLRVLVSNGELDSTGNVEIATFAASSALLKIGGQDVDYVDNGAIDFTDDDTAPSFDLMIFGGKFSRNGIPLDFISLVAFSSPGVFAFSQVAEQPPVFPSTNQVLESIEVIIPYKAVVSSGSLVTVTLVPEPASLAYLAVAMALLCGRRWRPRHGGSEGASPAL